MRSKRKTVISELKNHLIKYFGHSIQDVVLFGSQAHGTSDKDSDYDILIILNKDYSGSDENKILDLCYDINLKFDIILDVHIISDKELSTIRGKQPIFINAINSGVYA